ncbi:MAG TPA: glycosyltransferase family 39 protein [Solirubrobacteraceae bacterium]|nr:glycosyltransferase family 39 protein [Solirubrobacteraceae bacterium]
MDAPAGGLACLARSDPLRRLARTCARIWRSPPDQPSWSRPALLAIAAIAALAYAWGMGSDAVETTYGAMARSMSASWHDFLFGAFDPAGTVTIDKLPGALWPQALSLRLFGFHVWAIVLPQVLAGVATVLALFRVMRRLAGPVAGLTAAAVLAVSPVTVALNRGNVPDSLLILLLVLAADATVSALVGGRLRWLLLAAVWVGLAFQVKMLDAWAILPALAGAYLLSAPAPIRARVRHLALAGLATAAVSLSWMSAVSLVPARERPYVDGTTNDSLFSQVFYYNGLARLGRGAQVAGAGPRAEFLNAVSESGASASKRLAEQVPPGWDRLLGGIYGRDIGWLLPAALIAAAAVVLACRGRGRRDPRLSSVLMWSVWLLTLWAIFSDGLLLHSYYVASLVPALAGLCGTGAALAWSRRDRALTRGVAAAALLATLAYGAYLLHGGSGVPAWLLPAAICADALAALALLTAGTGILPGAMASRALAASACCALLMPAVAATLMVANGLGPFAAPFEPASATQSTARARQLNAASLAFVRAIESRYPARIAFATDTSRIAAPFIFVSGREILPIGGLEGGIPSPTLGQLRRYVSAGALRAFLIPPASRDPRLEWVYDHCPSTGLQTGGQVRLALYACGPT